MAKMVLDSSQLRAGDRIDVDGAVVLLAGKPITYPGHAGMLVYRWQGMPIVAGRVQTFPSLKRWDIQGNSLARWSVTRD